jgi:hypothetical protein
MKPCSSCKEILPLTMFCKFKRSKDGLHYYCRPCKSEHSKREYKKHREDYFRRCIAWRTTENGKKSMRNSYVKQRGSMPEKYKARYLLNAAVRQGVILKPGSCTICGSVAKLAAHHEDYTKPLQVEWMCYPCHTSHHAQITG